MVNTFLPYKNFKKCAECLDDKRLYKQIVECKQIATAIKNKNKKIKAGWQNHPITIMWEDNLSALMYYQWCCFREWTKRRWGFNIIKMPVNKRDIPMPYWLGDKELHFTHRCNLLRKNEEHYSKYFDIVEHSDYNNVDYKWICKGETNESN